MNNKTLPIIIAITLAMGILFSDFIVTAKPLLNKTKGQHSRPIDTVPGSSDKNNTPGAAAIMSSYPTIIYVDL